MKRALHVWLTTLVPTLLLPPQSGWLRASLRWPHDLSLQLFGGPY
jgi:hypothetical protein